jgi:hypothetical protein
MKSAILALILSTGAGNIALAQAVKIDKLSIRSRDYTDVEVTKLDEDRAMVRHSGGIARVSIMDLPENVRKRLGWKSDEQKKAEEAAKYPRLVAEWDLKSDSDKKLNETMLAFLNANPEAVVLRLVVLVRGTGAEWNKSIIYDREMKRLVVMTRTLPPKGVVESYQSFFWGSVAEDRLRKGIPWLDERGDPIKGIVTKTGESPFDPPISYKDRPEITEWP